MATPYKSNGVDFDNIFEPRGTTPKADDVGYSINGTDISDRYYPLSDGGSSPGITGYSTDGVDLNQIFAALGTVPYWIVPPFWSLKTYSADANTVEPNVPTAEVNLTVTGTGVVSFTRIVNFGTGVIIEQQTVKPANVNATDVEVRCTFVSGDGPLSNDLGNWVTLDGNSATAHNFVYRIGHTNGTPGTTTQSGTFHLEFRQISDNLSGTSADFNLTLSATMSEQPL